MASEAKAGAVTVRASVVLTGSAGVSGLITLEQEATGGATRLNGTIKGLKPGKHGFHVHQYGDLSQGCVSAGPHFNPNGKTHGGPTDEVRHVGDLGNVEADKDGNVEIKIVDAQVSLIGVNSVIGRSVIIHEKIDDLGKGGHELSATTGNAGGRLACGVIGIAANKA